MFGDAVDRAEAMLFGHPVVGRSNQAVLGTNDKRQAPSSKSDAPTLIFANALIGPAWSDSKFL